MPLTRAQQAAERLMRRLRLTTVPVDVDQVADRLGVQVEYEPLGAEVWGLLIARPGAPLVCVNRELPRSKQRAILAHELGHVVLRHPMPEGEHVHVDQSLSSGSPVKRGYKDCLPGGPHPRREQEASAFAASLLMPAKPLQEALSAIGHTALSEEEVETLARRFDVSTHGMMIRLSRMGIM